MGKEEDFSKILEQEETYIKKICDEIIAFKPDLVITEKGVSDLAQHFFNKAGVTAIRRLRKSDNLMVARACGATIVNRTEEITEEDIGTGAGLFEVRKIGDEYFTFIEECQDPKACTILLRGASKDILNEVERNLQDALNVARNLYMEPALVPGGGATEMEVAHLLTQMAKSLNGVVQWPYKAVASALEVIPRTLAQNCDIAMDAVKTVSMDNSGKKEIDIKRYAKVEKIPGGTIEDSQVLKGVMFNKDVTHPKMKRRIEKPRILLLDCNLEYKKGESQTNTEIMKEEDFSKALEAEETYIKKICDEIAAFKPDLVITEKGVSDLVLQIT